MSVFYTSFTDVQEQLMKETPAGGVPDPTTLEFNNFKAYLTDQLIPDVSKYLDYKTRRFFAPLLTTENYYNRKLLDKDSLAKNGYWFDFDEYRLWLDNDLLEITTYTSTDNVLSSAEYRLFEAPAIAVDLDTDSTDVDFDTDGFSDSQAVLGWWGYHTDWSNAFTAIENITVDDSATSITVVTDANDKYKFPQYVRCEDELMLITALVDDTTLTVTRGVRGTTTVAHSVKSLQTFAVDDSLHIAATRMCSWLYNNRVSQGNVVQISDSAVLLDQLPTMVKDTIAQLKKVGAV